MSDPQKEILRSFMLNKLSKKEREQVENRFLEDEQLLAQLVAIERDLLEDYFDEGLSPEDVERIREIYNDPARAHRVLVARTIHSAWPPQHHSEGFSKKFAKKEELLTSHTEMQSFATQFLRRWGVS